jgi:predicted permease
MHVEQGWSTDGFVVVEPHFLGNKYRSVDGRTAFMVQLSDEVGKLPGVGGVALAYQLPHTPSDISFETLETGDHKVPNVIVNINRVSGSYFKTLGIPMYAGRTFLSGEDANSTIITRQLAQQLWPGTSPLGKDFKMAGVGPGVERLTVVGVVGDVQTFGYNSKVEGVEVYVPFEAGRPGRTMHFLGVRSAGRSNVVDNLRRTIHELDPNLPVDIHPMSEIYMGTLADPIFNAILFGGFALLTVVLAVAGVYATVSYEVNRRIPEIGIRVALGATSGAVTLQVMRRALNLAVVGAAGGLFASIALARLMSSMLYEIRPTDPMTLAAATLLLIATVCIASYWPARRAASVDPVVALRNE